MKENFSKRVQYIIKQSKEEAIRLGHSYVGSEHLLIGLLKSETGMTKKIIDVFKIIKKNTKKTYLLQSIKSNSNIKIEYLELRNKNNLSPYFNKKNLKLFVCFYIKKVRLIDNF